MTTEELRALVDAATPGPWEYTPFRYSDKEIAAGQMDADTRLILLAPDLARLSADMGQMLEVVQEEEPRLMTRDIAEALAKLAELEAR